MIFYLIIFIVSLLTTLILNITLSPSDNVVIIIWFLAYFFIELAIDSLVAFIVHKLPHKCVNPYLKLYKVHRWERKFYERIGIKKWKELVPDSGEKLCGFGKKQIKDPGDKAYVYKFMEETCYAELMHNICVVCSFLILLIPNGGLVLSLALPIAFINAFTQLLPVFIQRYVRPKLLVLYKRLTR